MKLPFELPRGVHAAALYLAGLGLRPIGHRGLYRVAGHLARFSPPDRGVVVALPHGARMRILLSDPYWARLVAPGYRYEPDVGWILSRVLRHRTDVQFLDLGANFGYWSAIASAIAPGRVLAVEASPAMHVNLVETARLNDDRFSVHAPAAVWSRSGKSLELVTHVVRHAGASVVDRKTKADTDGYRAFVVPSVTVDDLAAVLAPGPLLVKLDVEGVEIQGFEGARNTVSSRDTMFVYEDHGKDRSSHVSEYVMSHGFQVASVRNNRVQHLLRHEDVKRVKRDPSVGYNFVAYRRESELARALGL